MSKIIREYFDALQRLVDNKPCVVSKGTKITKDSVSLEAGRSKGSIKKSRVEFSILITAIEKATREQRITPLQKYKEIAIKSKASTEKYKQLFKEALNRELMLIDRVACLEKEVKNIRLKNPLLKV